MALKAFKSAFPYTVPILTGFTFLGIAYGIYMNVSGFSFWYPLIMSIVIFGGSMQFVAVEMLLSPFAPLQVFIMALLVQARHLFYGLSMLDKFKGMGLKKYYLIFGMCDETFSINCAVEPPEGVDRGLFMFFVTLLNQIYWVAASAVGGILGSLLTFSTDGISFVMTAVFVVIFVEQWLKDRRHISSCIGLISSCACLVVFGANSFLLPSMAVIILLLSLLRKPIESKEAE